MSPELEPAWSITIPPTPGSNPTAWTNLSRADQAKAWRESPTPPDFNAALRVIQEAGSWAFHGCPMCCGYLCSFIYSQGQGWFYDSGCHCVYYHTPPRPRTQDDVRSALEMNPHLAAALTFTPPEDPQ